MINNDPVSPLLKCGGDQLVILTTVLLLPIPVAVLSHKKARKSFPLGPASQGRLEPSAIKTCKLIKCFFKLCFNQHFLKHVWWNKYHIACYSISPNSVFPNCAR